MKRFIDFLQKQKKKIEEHKWISSEKVGHDLGQEAVHEWITKYAKIFRKEYALDDMQESIQELQEIMKDVHDEKINRILEQCLEKLEDAKELIESEPENGKDKTNGKTV
jgi:succinate dehydrogenase/fumarate reductase flavoprotein subunit